MALPRHNFYIGPELCQTADWTDMLHDCSSIIHLAAAVRFSEKGLSSLAKSKIYNVNIEGTQSLCRQAIKAGVNKFIFVSSIAASAGTLFEKKKQG